jgi:hypothetical protein
MDANENLKGEGDLLRGPKSSVLSFPMGTVSMPLRFLRSLASIRYTIV